MPFQGQRILPAAKHMKQLEGILDSSYEYAVFLDTHVAQLRNLYQMARSRSKQMLLHADLVQGLKNDEYAAEYLCQEIKPFGIISTRSGVIATAKKRGFLLYSGCSCSIRLRWKKATRWWKKHDLIILRCCLVLFHL